MTWFNLISCNKILFYHIQFDLIQSNFYYFSQVGSSLILDATGSEQACASSVFSVAVNRSGNCCGFNTTLGGQFESIDIATAVLVSTYIFTVLPSSNITYSTLLFFNICCLPFLFVFIMSMQFLWSTFLAVWKLLFILHRSYLSIFYDFIFHLFFNFFYFIISQNASASSSPLFTWMDTCYSNNSTSDSPDSLYPDVPPIRKGLLA